MPPLQTADSARSPALSQSRTHFPKTEAGAELRDAVNEVIQEMLDDGTIASITEKWLGDDMTKRIIPEDTQE